MEDQDYEEPSAAGLELGRMFGMMTVLAIAAVLSLVVMYVDLSSGVFDPTTLGAVIPR